MQTIRDLIFSKINWVQIVGIVATVLGLFGIDFTPEQQAAWVTGVQGVAAFVTVIIRTFFTKAEPK